MNIILQLLLRNTANRRVLSLHRNILQIVQLTEYAELGELVDSGNENEPQIRVETLDRAIEIPHYLPQGRKPDLVVHHIQQRCVIFINDQHSWFPGLGKRLFYQKLQPCVDIHLVQILTFTINSFIFSKFIVELAQQLILVHVLGCGHVEMEDRVPRPFFLHISGLEPFEKFFLSFEVTTESRGQQGFTETTRTAQEHVLVSLRQIVHKTCLVDVEVTSLDNITECLYPDRVSFESGLHNSI